MFTLPEARLPRNRPLTSAVLSLLRGVAQHAGALVVVSFPFLCCSLTGCPGAPCAEGGTSQSSLWAAEEAETGLDRGAGQLNSDYAVTSSQGCYVPCLSAHHTGNTTSDNLPNP